MSTIFFKKLNEELFDRDSRPVLKQEDYILDRQSKITPPSKPTNYPDARLHKIVSFVKSGVRILGYCFLPFELNIAAIILILSEAIGIIEETV